MIFCHKNEKEITLGADSAQENRGSHAKVSVFENIGNKNGNLVFDFQTSSLIDGVMRI